uniref:Ribonuclease n=1 Tax=Rhodosorus marinus TaxID=101924 RepID=A0A7S2Z996_9RHOD|mmetsp:Transcript_10187/g.42692  ORF Transcript_10187/g.42692 Transcript_10187/m.42692 type:complete len:276 (+) Transcript_10187:178-1005(+)
MEVTGPCVVGIDEAGRGPVLGPMVYGAAVCEVDKQDCLRDLGCDDSKAMSEQDREAVRDRMRDSGLVRVYTKVLQAEELSRCMLRKRPYNLNAISHDTAAGLVRQILKDGTDIEHLYVDTVGIPERYEAWLRKEFPGIKAITVAKKADSTYAIVGAASIFAKTLRDHILRFWDSPDLDPELRGNYGSGYPGDPATISWLKRAVDPHFGFPGLVRFSWSTSKNVLDATGAVQVAFEEEDSEENQSNILNHFKRKTGKEELPKYFMDRRLCEESNFL